jgi:hypothetical protein
VTLQQIKALQFAEGSAVTPPTELASYAFGFKAYASDAAFVTAKGSAAAVGDSYYNSTANTVKYYNGSAWLTVVDTTTDLALGVKAYADDAAFVTANGAAAVGDFYYNTTANTLKYYDGAWKTLASTASALTNPMTTTGDIIYSSDNSGTAARLAKGAAGKQLTMSGTIPAWYWQVSSQAVLDTGNLTFTITDSDGHHAIFGECGGAARTTTLPAAANNAGRVLIFKKTDIGTDESGGFQWNIAAAGSDTIDGATYVRLYTQYAQVKLVSNGVNWFCIEGPIEHGIYTPALTSVANIESSGASVCRYSRMGNYVSVAGVVDINVQFMNTLTRLGISLPIPSNFTSSVDLAGAANIQQNVTTNTYSGPILYADTTNDRAELYYVPGSAVDPGNTSLSFTFGYTIK